jgi:hypothetical protein
MNWSTEQRRILQAMGHEVLVRAGTAEALPPAETTGAGVVTSDAPARATANPPGFATLQRALRRAAGDRDVSGLVGDLERLRRDPLLKRALWPQLRALRRSH